MKKLFAALVALVMVPVFMGSVATTALAQTDTGSVAGVTDQNNVSNDNKGDVKGTSDQKSFWASNWFIILLIIAVLGGGAYWFFIAKKDQDNN